jgi:hypothetical protein
MAHLINRLEFEMNCADEEQAFHLRHNFALTYQEQIVKAVDRVCSAYVDADEWVTIDRLTIDLGHFTPVAFEDNFAGVFQQKFEKEFVEKLSRLSPEQKKVELDISGTELFQYFLQTGVLPWWASNMEVNLDETAIELIRDQQEIVRAFFYRHRSVSTLWKRAALQLNKFTKSSIVDLIAELSEAKRVISGWVKLIIESSPGLTGIAALNEEYIIDDLVIIGAPVILKNRSNKLAFWSVLEDSIERISPGNSSLLRHVLEKNKNSLVGKDMTHVELIAGEDMSEELITKSFDINPTGESIITVLPEKYFVTHSGIVLLSLFLQPFFRNLGLLHEGEWKDINAQYQAIHFLKFLSTGEQRAPEYHLLLEKLICGLPVEMPVPLDIVLPEEALKESNDLLESVISHWKALKNTSVNGLRDAFLKRDGLLIKKDEGWLLQVERKTLDVLIDTIPWGYSTLKFPWNPYVIFVEW